MKLYNLIEQSILKGNFLNIGGNDIIDQQMILKKLVRLFLLLTLGSIIVSKEYKKYALVCLSIFVYVIVHVLYIFLRICLYVGLYIC